MFSKLADGATKVPVIGTPLLTTRGPFGSLRPSTRVASEASVPPVGQLYIKRTLGWEGRYLLDTAVRMLDSRGLLPCPAPRAISYQLDPRRREPPSEYSCQGDFAR